MQTKWHVITGGPSCGKTSVIQYLSFLGYLTTPEVARLYIDEERSKGRRIEIIRADEAEFQQTVLKMKVELESRISPQQVVFMDRGLPDSIAYFALYHQDPTRVIQASPKRRYQTIFILDQLPFEKDYARTETDEIAQNLATAIDSAYTNLGYAVVRVPVMPISDRAQYILMYKKDADVSSIAASVV